MKKEKTSYCFLSNMKYLLTNMWKLQKKTTVYIFLRAPFVVLIPFLNIWLSKEVISAVTMESTVEDVLITIGIISTVLIVCGICEKYLTAVLYRFLMMTDLHWQMILFDKTISMDYENLENPKGLTKLSKAMENCGNEQSNTRIVAETVSSFVSNIIGIVSYAGLLITLSPAIMLVVIFTTTTGFFY